MTTNEPTPRDLAIKNAGLTHAQWDALDKFAQPGGHGYGEFAYLPIPTARALERRGLVTLGRRESLRGRLFRHGEATAAGRAVLASIKAEIDATFARHAAESRALIAELEARHAGRS